MPARDAASVDWLRFGPSVRDLIHLCKIISQVVTNFLVYNNGKIKNASVLTEVWQDATS